MFQGHKQYKVVQKGERLRSYDDVTNTRKLVIVAVFEATDRMYFVHYVRVKIFYTQATHTPKQAQNRGLSEVIE